MWNVWNHPSYQYQRRILFNSLKEVNRITQYSPWNTQIYLIQIIPSEKTMMKTPQVETKRTTQYETQQQQQPKKSPPHMKLFYSKSSATTKRGCYGTLNFLTSQALFENVFGKNPHMFAAQPNNLNNTNNKEATTKYLDLCKLEILLDGVQSKMSTFLHALSFEWTENL